MILEKERCPPPPPPHDETPGEIESGEKVLGVFTWRGFKPAIILRRDGFVWRGKKYSFSDVIGLSNAPRRRGLSGIFESRDCHLILRDGEVVFVSSDLEREGEDPLPDAWLTSAQPFGDLKHALENQPATRSFAEFVRLVRKRADPRRFTPPPDGIVPLALFLGWLVGGIAGIVFTRVPPTAGPHGLYTCVAGSLAFLLAGAVMGVWVRRRLWGRRVAALLAREPERPAPAD